MGQPLQQTTTTITTGIIPRPRTRDAEPGAPGHDEPGEWIEPDSCAEPSSWLEPAPASSREHGVQPSDVAAFGRLHSAPFGFVLRVALNGAPRAVPLVIEEPGAAFDLARAADLVRRQGGFTARVLRTARGEARIRLACARDVAGAAYRIRALADELLDASVGNLASALDTQEPISLDVQPEAADELLVRLHAEGSCSTLCDELWAAARSISRTLERLAGARASVSVSVRARERVQASCRIPLAELAAAAWVGSWGTPASEARATIARAARALGTDAPDTPVAAAHNQVVQSAVAAVALAFGNAPERALADALAHAARYCGCEPLGTWRVEGASAVGELELPLQVDAHGRWRSSEASAEDVFLLSASAGMTASLVALLDTLRGGADRASQKPPPRRPRRSSRPLPPPRQRRSAR